MPGVSATHFETVRDAGNAREAGESTGPARHDDSVRRAGAWS
jgi:hypothetical protein